MKANHSIIFVLYLRLPTPPDGIDREFIREILLGDVRVAFLFAKIIQNSSKEDLDKIFNSLNNHGFPINRFSTKVFFHPVLYYDYLNEFAKEFEFTKFPETLRLFHPDTQYYIELYRLDKRWSDSLIPLLQNPSLINEKNASLLNDRSPRSALRYLSQLLKEYPGLYRSLSTPISSLLSKIGINLLCQQEQVNSLDFLDCIEEEFLSNFPLDSITQTSFPIFWQSPILLMNGKAASSFQVLLAAQEPFPTPSQIIDNNQLTSLLNDSIIRKQHFIDILYFRSHNVLNTRDFSTLVEMLNVIPSFKSWIFFANYDSLSADPTFISEILPMYETPDFYLDLFNRLKNDQLLVPFVNQNSGIKVTLDEIIDSKSNSIPRFLEHTITQVDYDSLHNFAINNYFSVSDQDRDSDAYFLFSYQAYYSVLEAFRNGFVDHNKLDSSLEAVSEQPGFSDLLADIFSLLFLKDSKGHFICSFELAQELLSVIVLNAKGTSAGDYIIKAFSKVQKGMIMEYTTLEQCFASSMEDFLDALQAGHFELALSLTEGNSVLTKLVDLSKKIREQKDSLQTSDEELLRELIALHGNKIKQKSTFTDEVERRFLTQRQNEKEEDILNPIKETANVGYLSKRFNEYLELYANVTGNLKSDQQSNIIENIVESDQELTWKSITSLLGENAFEKIVLNCDLSRAHPKILSLFDEISPLIRKSINQSSLYHKDTCKNFDELLSCLPDKSKKSMIKKFLTGSEFKSENTLEKAESFVKIFKIAKSEKNGLNELLDFADLFFVEGIPKYVLDFLYSDAISTKNIPFLIEMKDHFFDFIQEKKTQIQKLFTLKDYLEIFVEDYTKPLSNAIELNITSTEPLKIIEQLIHHHDILSAYLYSRDKNLEKEMFDISVKYFSDQIQSPESSKIDFKSIFSKCELIGKQIYNLLPTNLKSTETEILFMGKDFDDEEAIEQKSKENKDIIEDQNQAKKDIGGLKISKSEQDCLDMLSKYPELNYDSTLLSYAKKMISKPEGREHIIGQMIDAFKDPSILINLICTTITNEIRKLTVKNPQDEDGAEKVLSNFSSDLVKSKSKFLKRSSSNFAGEHLLYQINWLKKFCGEKFNMRFGFQYSFSAFTSNSEEGIGQFCQACLKYDELHLIYECAPIWDLQLSKLILKVAERCFTINETEAGLKYLVLSQKYSNDLSNSDPLKYRLSVAELTQICQLLLHPSIFQYTLFDNPLHVECTPIDYQVTKVIRGFGGQLLTSGQISSLEVVLDAFPSTIDKIEFDSTYTRFQHAFSLWDTLPMSSKNVGTAVRAIFIPVMATTQWIQLWSYVQRNKENLGSFLLVVKDLLDFLEDKGMLETMADIQIKLNMEEGILTLKQIGLIENSWKEKQAHLSSLSFYLETLERQGQKITIINSTDLIFLKRALDVQIEFTNFAIKSNLQFDKKFDLLSCQPERLEIIVSEMALIALQNEQFSLGVKISKLKNNSLMNIADKLVSILNSSGNRQIQKYLGQMGKVMNPVEYELLASHIMVCIASAAVRKSDLPAFIMAHITGKDLQIKLLLKFGFPAQALQVAEQIGSKQYYFLIQNSAMECKDKATVARCKKLLSK